MKNGKVFSQTTRCHVHFARYPARRKRIVLRAFYRQWSRRALGHVSRVGYKCRVDAQPVSRRASLSRFLPHPYEFCLVATRGKQLLDKRNTRYRWPPGYEISFAIPGDFANRGLVGKSSDSKSLTASIVVLETIVLRISLLKERERGSLSSSHFC